MTGAATPRRWFRVSLWLHRWTGLVATPFFLLLCITGSILIFHLEVDRLLGDFPAESAAAGPPMAPAALAAAAMAAARPGETVQSLAFSSALPDKAFAGFALPGSHALEAERLVLLDRATGQVLPFADPETSFTGFLFDLHANWFLDVPGEIFGGVIALLVLVAVVTGIIVHAPFLRGLAFGSIRHGHSERRRQRDLHNFIGAIVTGWLIVVCLTGLALGLGSLALARWQDTELRAMAGSPTQAPVPVAARVSVDVALATAQAAQPDRDAQFIIWPGTDFSSPRHYAFLMYGRQPYNERLFDIVLVDAATGKLAAARPLPTYLQAVVLSGPLHFGDYGGLPLKLLWLASAWGALFITANGAWLWWAKRRRAPEAAPQPLAAE
jgi:uncharacterized iron-regulated membrane protein